MDKQKLGRRGCLLLGALGPFGCSAEVSSDPGGDLPAVSTSDAVKREPDRTLAANTRFFAPPPLEGAVDQIVALARARKFRDAALVGAMVATPQAVWFTGGTPSEVKRNVRETMRAAALTGRVPVLVPYNVPFRDCSQYSAGGASDTAAYNAWIDAFAAGIGTGKAVVILEPDSLGIIPYNTTLYGVAEWCQPTVQGPDGTAAPAPGATPTERYAQLNHAVDAIERRAPAATLYLDGTHSAWLGVGEAASRLSRAGLERTQGFYLNVSNYQPTPELEQFGAWVSACVTAATRGADWARGHFDWCPSQYNPERDFALDFSPHYAATVTAGLEDMMNGVPATTHFVLDTSRNGRGAWHAEPQASYPDAQEWCNPPKRGAGLRPSANTGYPLLDATLWIKLPGASDGACNRGIVGSETDPEWGGGVDPAAGAWFPPQALELARLASPPLL